MQRRALQKLQINRLVGRGGPGAQAPESGGRWFYAGPRPREEAAAAEGGA